MQQSKFQHMAEKEHYKMYKAGKMWVFANIVALSLGTIMATGLTQSVKADSTTNDSVATETSVSNSASQNQSTNQDALKGNTAQSTSTSKTSQTAGATTSTTSSAASPTASNAEDTMATAKTNSTASESGQPNIAAAKSSTSNQGSQTATDQSAQSQTQKTSTSVASAKASATPLSSTASSKNETIASVAQTTPTVNSLSATSLASAAATTDTSRQATAVETTVDPTKFVKGTMVTTAQDGTLIVTLPAGTSAANILAAKQVLSTAGVTKARITATDAATETDYQLGVDAGKATFANGADSFGGSPAGSDTLLDLIGNVIGDGTTFTDSTSTTAQLNQSVAQNSPDFSGIDTNVDLTQPQTTTANASNKAALKAINQWVDGIMAKLNWDVLSHVKASQVAGHEGADFHNGYVDTIKAYAKGELTVEGYYLWLLKLTDSTNNSLYYGTQGYAEQFKTLITALNSVKDDSAYTANADVKNAYDGGFTTIVAWISADSNAVKEMQDLGMDIGSYSEGGDFTTSDFATNWGNEGAKNLIGGITQSMTGSPYPGVSPITLKILGIGGRTGANVMTINFGDTVASYWQKFLTDGGGSHLVISTSNAGGAMSSVEGAVFWQTLQAQYDSWRQIVDAAFEQATKDALAGKAQALDKNTQVLSVLKLPAAYVNLSGSALIQATKEYQWGYLLAKGYLDGTPTNASDMTNETTPNKASQAIVHGYGNTPITATTGSGTADTDTTIPSPIDLAIYSVLKGKTFTYNTTTTDVDGNKVTPIVGKNAQSIGTPAGATNVDWVQTAAQPHMYQLIWNVANQAKSDFLADLQQLVNSGNQSKIDLTDITKVLPSDSSQGMLTDAQYTYYKNNSYVYYKVFEALYDGYMVKTFNGKTVNVITQAMTDADNYVKAAGDAMYGQPTAEDITPAQKDDPLLIASVDAGYTDTLNADRYYTGSYSAGNQGTTFADITSGGKANDANTVLNSTNLTGDSNANKTIQNAINYAFVHEESMAIPAYEAGYAAVQTSINSTPATKADAIGTPTTSDGAFTFENNSTVSDNLTPNLETTNPNGSTIWTVHYTNNDGTALTVYINRDVPSTTDPLGAVKSIRVVASADGLKDDQGNLVTLKNAAGESITSADSGAVVGPIGTTAQTSYISFALSGNVTNDQQKLTTVTVNLTADGKVHYSFNRDSVNSVNTALTDNQVTTDGTLQGTLYQAGWDYRKTFISNITIKQQVSDPNYVDSKTGSQAITADQIYSGFYQTAVKNADGSYTIQKNSSVQLDPNNDVNGTGDDAYGTYKKYTITNLDGSSVDVTLNVNGEVSYVVHDLNKNATSGTLDLKTNSVTITNKDITDATSQFAPSHVVITRTANGAITVSETGIQARMVNKITVENEGTAADTTVVMGTDVEPSYSSTTIVTPVSAMHPGVVFTKDTKSADFTNGVKSEFDATKTANPADQALIYQNQDITTTIQYVANNVENQHSGATAAADMSTATPTITISLGKNAQNQDISTSSFDPNDTATDDTGSAIFDWGTTTLPTGWTYDATTQTLKYAPTAGSAESKFLIDAVATGSYTINWSGQTKTGMSGSLSNALVDSYNDVMNLAVTAQVKSQNTINQTINTSADVNSDHQYTFTNTAIVAATSKNDPADLVTAMIENLVGTDGKEYTGTMNGLALPAGVSKVKLNADGSVTVTYDPDKATANYDATSGKNIISLVLPLTADAQGNYVPEATGSTTPMANLTLDMTLEANTTVNYVLSAGAGSETLNDSTVITFGEPGTDIQTAKTGTVALGADFYTDAPANIVTTKATNYLGGTTNGQYILLTGNTDLSKTPKTITNEQHTSKFGDNSVVYTYAKSAGFVWNTSILYPKVVDTDTNAQDTGLNSSVDLKDILGGFDSSTLKFTPEQNPTYPGISVGASFSGTVLNFTNTNTKNDPTSLAAYAQLLFTYGFGTSGWLTDAKGNAMYLYVGSDTLPTKNPTLPESDVTININTPSTGSDGYQIDANGNATYTFDFDMGDNTVTRKQMMAINSSIAQLLDGDLVRDSGEGALAIIKQYYDTNATEDSLKEWQNLSTITMDTTPDGKGQVKVTIEPTLSGFVSKQNAAKLFMANNTVTGESSIGGVKIHLNFTTNLTQDSDGLPDALKPSYDAKNDQALGSTYTISAQKVTGYHVTGAKDQNGNDVNAKNLTVNTDGTATYNGTYDWGIAKAGDTKPIADKITWVYAQDTITGAIGQQNKFYGMADPTTGYPVTGVPSWLNVPTDGWTAADFTRTHAASNTTNDDTKDSVGSYDVTLSAAGIAALQAANENYTIEARTLSGITKGTLLIQAAPIKSTTTDGSRVYDGQTLAADSKNNDGSQYEPTLTFTATDPKTSTTTPESLKLTANDYTYYDANGTKIDPADIKAIGKYTWKLNDAGKADLYKQLGNSDGLATNLNFLMDDNSIYEGTFEITADPLIVSTQSGVRTYNGQAIAADHSSTDKNDITGISFAVKNGDSTTAPSAVTLDVSTDFTFTNAAATDKDAAIYTWTVNAAGLTKIYKALGSADGNAAKANFSIDESLLHGTYTINKKAVTVTLSPVTATYDGTSHSVTATDAERKTGVGDDEVMVTLTGADRTDAGHNDVTGVADTTATGNKANANYDVTVAQTTITISPAAVTITGRTVSKTYDGQAYTGTGDKDTTVATITDKPAAGTDLVYTLTDLTKDTDQGTYDINVTVKDSDNPNYVVTVVAGKLTINKQVLTTAQSNTPTAPVNPDQPNDNTPKTDSDQAKTSLTIIGQTKVYDDDSSSDPTVYTIQKPSQFTNFTVPTLTADDFDFSGIDKQDVGSYQVTLSAAGLLKLQNANQNYSFTTADIQNGLFVITPTSADLKGNTGTKTYDTKTVADDLTATRYTPAVINISTGVGAPAKAPNASYLQDLDFAVDSNPLDNLKLTNADIFWFDASDPTETPISTDQISHAGVYHWKLNATGKASVLSQIGPNYTLTDDQLSTIYGSYTINQGSVKITANADSRDYDGQAFTDNHNGKDGQTFTPTLTFDSQIGDSTTLSLAVNDYQFTDADGHIIAAADLKNSGKYTWTLTDQGKKDLYARLGSREDKQYAESDTNYAIDTTSVMSGTYTINPIAVTITAPTLTKTYNGSAYASTDDNGKTVTGTVSGVPTNGVAPAFTLTDISADKDAGTYPISAIYDETAAVNANYEITVAAGSLTINKRTGVSLTVLGQSKVYDNNASTDPTTYTVQGPSDYPTFTVPALPADDFDTTGITSQNVGSYTVKLSAAGLKKIQDANAKNFSVDATDITDAQFTITKRPVTVTADNQTKVFGDADPELTKAVSGVDGDKNSGLVSGDPLHVTLIRTAGETPGDYKISVIDGKNPNYDITNKTGTLTIYPKVTIQYVDQDGKLLTQVPEKTVSDQKSGTNLTIDQPSVAGYTLEPNQSTSYHIDEDGTQTVTVTYRQNASIVANYYVQGSTNKIADSVTTNSGVGLAYTASAANVAGYTLVATPANATGTYAATNEPVDYYYTVDYTAVPVDNNDKPISNVPTKTGTGKPGDPVDPDGGLPTIPGYTLTTAPKVPNEPGQVNVVYTPDTENVKVNYFIQGRSTSLKPSETLSGKFASDYTTTAADVTGYHLVATPTNAKGTYAVTNSDVNYYYAPNDESVKVNYYIQGTTTSLKPSTTVTGKFGEDYETTAQSVTGYHLVSTPTNAKGTYAVNNNDVNYYYAPNDASVKANYYVEGTMTSLKPSVTVPGKFGEDYATTAETVTGYHLVATPANAKGTYTITNDDVNYYYKADTEAVTANYYVKDTATPITDSETLTGPFNGQYSTRAATVNGYTLVSTPENATGTYGVTNKPVNYYYTVDYTAVPVDNNGQQIPNVSTKTGTGTPGDPIDPDGGLPTIPGYTLTTTSNVPNKPGQVNVVYTPNTEIVKVNYFVEGTTTSLKPSETLSGKFGSDYTTIAADVTGYHLVATPTNAKGTYAVSNDDVTYYYAPNDESVKVNYYIQGTTTSLKPSVTVTGKFGGDYTTTAETITGYHLVSTPVNAKGTYAVTNADVTYYYAPNDASVKVNYYVEGTTTSLNPGVTVSGKFGSDYATTVADVTGYHLVAMPANATGTYAVTNSDVNYYYAPNDASVRVNYYIQDTTTSLKPSVTVAGKFGESYTTSVVTVPGYALVGTPVNATGKYGVDQTEVNYEYVPVTETVAVNYLIKGSTTPIIKSDTLTGPFDSTYETTPAKLSGYTLVSLPSNQTGTYGLTNKPVNYYYTVDYTTVSVDNNGKQIPNVPANAGTGTPGDPIDPDGGLPAIPGYTLTTTPNVPSKPGNVNVVYTPDTENVKVNYFVQGTKNALKPNETLFGKFGSDYTTTAKSVTGYHLVSTPTNANGTYALTNDPVDYYYAPNDELVKVNYYIQGTTTLLKPSVTVTGKFGGDYTTTAELIMGYHLVSMPVNAKGMYAVTNGDVNYYYASDSETVTANYLVQGTTTSLSLSVTVSGKFGGDYMTTAESVTGYHLVSMPTNAKGTYAVTNSDVNYYYAPNDESVKVDYYVKGTTTPIKPSDMLNGLFGSKYSTEPATVEGYTSVSTPANATGTYDVTNKSVNYYYTVDYTAVPVDNNGKQIPNVPTNAGTGTPGVSINPNGGLPMIPGYTLTTTPNVPGKPGQVNVVYTPNTENVKVNYFIQSTTTPITSGETLTGAFGSNYTTTAATVAGYTLVSTPSNADGKYAVTNGAVNYYYTVNYTVIPTLPNGKPISGVTTPNGSGLPNDPTDPNGGFPEIPGYTRTTRPAVPGKPGNVIVIYTPNPEDVEVNYYFKGTTIPVPGIKRAFKISGVFGEAYQTDAPEVNGYTLVQVPDNAAGTFGLKNRAVNYYYLMNYEIVPVDNNGHVIPNAPVIKGIGLPGEPIEQAKLPKIPGYTLVTTVVHVPRQPDVVKIVYVKQEPNKPITPVEPNKPVQPNNPVTPVKPITPTKPVEPTTPTEPVTPTKPITPVQPGQPTTVTKPSAPAEVTPMPVELASRPRQTVSTRPAVKAMPTKRQATVLPHTGERDSFALVVAGLSLMTSGFIFMGVRKFRRQRNVSARKTETTGKI